METLHRDHQQTAVLCAPPDFEMTSMEHTSWLDCEMDIPSPHFVAADQNVSPRLFKMRAMNSLCGDVRAFLR
jgi:hypothetical protein